MSNHFDSARIDFNIISEIILEAENKYKKEKKQDPKIEFDIIHILSSYSKTLSKHNINSKTDTSYYKFLLKLSVFNNKQTNKNWFESLKLMMNFIEPEINVKKSFNSNETKKKFESFENKEISNNSKIVYLPLPYPKINKKNQENKDLLNIINKNLESIEGNLNDIKKSTNNLKKTKKNYSFIENNNENYEKNKNNSFDIENVKFSKNENLNIEDLIEQEMNSQTKISPNQNENLKIKSKYFYKLYKYMHYKKEKRKKLIKLKEKFTLAKKTYKKNLLFKCFFLLAASKKMKKEKKIRERIIILKTRKNIKRKFFNIYIINFKFKQLQNKAKNSAIKFSNHILKKNCLKSWNLLFKKREIIIDQKYKNNIVIYFLLYLIISLNEKNKENIFDKLKYLPNYKYKNEIISKLKKSCFIPKTKIQYLDHYLLWMHFNIESKYFQKLKKYHFLLKKNQQYYSSKMKFKVFYHLKKLFFRRKEIRSKYKETKLKNKKNLIDKILNKWRSITCKKASLQRKYQFYITEKKHKIKKKYYNNILNEYSNILNQKKNNQEIIDMFQFKTKQNIFFSWNLLIKKIIDSKNKKNQMKILYREKLLNLIIGILKKYFFRKINERKIFKKIKLKNIYFSLEKYLKKWIKISNRVLLTKLYYQNTIKKKIFVVFTKLIEISIKNNEKLLSFNSKKSISLKKKIFNKLNDFLNDCKNKQIKKINSEDYNNYINLKKIFNKLKNNYIYMKKFHEKAYLYFCLNKKKLIIQAWKNVTYSKINLELVFHQYKKLRNRKFLLNFLKKWKNKSNLKFKLNKKKKFADNFYKKKVKKMYFYKIMSFFNKKNELNEIISKIKNNKKKIFLKCWIQETKYLIDILNFQEKKNKKKQEKIFKLMKSFIRKKITRKLIISHMNLLNLNKFFQILKNYSLYKKNQYSHYNNIFTNIYLNKLNKTLQIMKCFCLIQQKKREIINFLQNKKIIKMIHVFFENLKKLKETKILKDKILENLLEKNNYKKIGQTFDFLKSFTEKNKGKNIYKQKINVYYTLKKMDYFFRKIKENCYNNFNNKFQIQNLFHNYYEKYCNENKISILSSLKEIKNNKKNIEKIIEVFKKYIYKFSFRKLFHNLLNKKEKEIIYNKELFAFEIISKIDFFAKLQEFIQLKKENNYKTIFSNEFYFNKLMKKSIQSIQLNSINKKKKIFAIKHYAINIISNALNKWKNYLEEQKEKNYLKILSKSNHNSILFDENSLDLSNKFFSSTILNNKDCSNLDFSFEKDQYTSKFNQSPE